MEYTRKQLDEKYEELPNDIQEALYADNVVKELKEIEKKYALNREQTISLSAEIGEIMFGTSSPQHFISNIQKEMGISEDSAKTIAAEVNEKIFRPVKESLKTIHSLNKKEEMHKINMIPTNSLIKSEENRGLRESASVKNFGETKEEPKTETVDPYREAV